MEEFGGVLSGARAWATWQTMGTCFARKDAEQDAARRDEKAELLARYEQLKSRWYLQQPVEIYSKSDELWCPGVIDSVSGNTEVHSRLSLA